MTNSVEKTRFLALDRKSKNLSEHHRDSRVMLLIQLKVISPTSDEYISLYIVK